MIRILICDDEGIVQQSLTFMIEKSFGKECDRICKKWKNRH
jgi:two-component system response regulator YesN